MKDGMYDQPELKSFNSVTEDFEDIIEDLGIESKAKVGADPRGVTLEIDGDICFESGSMTIHSTLAEVLNQASSKVFAQQDDFRLIVVEGHTDLITFQNLYKKFILQIGNYLQRGHQKL